MSGDEVAGWLAVGFFCIFLPLFLNHNREDLEPVYAAIRRGLARVAWLALFFALGLVGHRLQPT